MYNNGELDDVPNVECKVRKSDNVPGKFIVDPLTKQSLPVINDELIHARLKVVKRDLSRVVSLSSESNEFGLEVTGLSTDFCDLLVDVGTKIRSGIFSGYSPFEHGDCIATITNMEIRLIRIGPDITNCTGFPIDVNARRLIDSDIFRFTGIVNETVGSLQSNYSKVRPAMRGNVSLCDNIVYYGIPESARKVISGNAQAKASIKNVFSNRNARMSE